MGNEERVICEDRCVKVEQAALFLCAVRDYEKHKHTPHNRKSDLITDLSSRTGRSAPLWSPSLPPSWRKGWRPVCVLLDRSQSE